MLAADRDAGRVNLRVAGVGEEGALLVGAPGGGDVAALGVGGKKKHVAVAAGGQHHRVARVGRDLAGDQVADDDAPGLAVDDHQVEHLRARKHLDGAEADLAAERLVGAQQQLLAGLAAGVKRARNLRPAERAVGQQPAVFARERHALRHALVDDVRADLRQAIDVGLARAEIAALDGVVEEPVNAVAVVLVVLGGVDAALGGDAVRAARAVLEAEALDLVAQLGQRRRGRSARQAAADDDDVELALVGRVDQLHVELVFVPLLGERAGQDDIYDRFIALFKERTEQIRLGYGWDTPDVDMGPLITERAVSDMEKMVSYALADGGRILVGGKRASDLKGYYFEPTAITDLPHSSKVVQEGDIRSDSDH